jgi:hypothetical protein
MNKIVKQTFAMRFVQVVFALGVFAAFVSLAGAFASTQPATPSSTPAVVDMTPRYTVIEYGAQIDQMRRDVADIRGEARDAQAIAGGLRLLRAHDIAVRDAQIAEDRLRIAALEQQVYDLQQMRMSDYLAAYEAQSDNLKRLYELEFALYCAGDGALCPEGGGP